MTKKNGRETKKKKRKKRHHGARANAKGGGFERTICKRLSLWWTHNKRDDVFWRTAGSGARAMSRRKASQRTSNSAGDMCALDPCGLPFIKLILPEMKRGYTQGSERIDLLKLLDRLPGQKPCLLQRWIDKAKKEASSERRPHIMLIIQRDRSKPVVLIKTIFLLQLYERAKRLYLGDKISITVDDVDIGGYTIVELEEFLSWCDPKWIEEMGAKICRRS